MPLANPKCSDEVQASVASTQFKVLSVAPLRVIPPPSAAVSRVLSAPKTKFLSSTAIVVEFIVVVVPFTVKSPETTKSLFTVTVPPFVDPKFILVVEEAAPPVPMFRVLVTPEPAAPVDILVIEAAVLEYPRVTPVAAAPMVIEVAVVSNKLATADVVLRSPPFKFKSPVIVKSAVEGL